MNWYFLPYAQLLFWLALFKGIAHLGYVIFYEVQTPMHWDSLMYVTVARGMLNELTPYYDLFETKPFGIFLLFALCLLVSFKLATALNIVSFSAYPFLNRRYVLIGILLALYVETRGVFLQTEVFGALFSSLFILTMGNLWVSTLFFGLSLSMKEPFLLVNLAAVILLRRNVLRCFLWPLLISAVVGVVVVAVLDIPYFTEYLPLMRLRVGLSDVWWVRGLLWTRLLYNLNIFAPFFGVLMILLWLPERIAGAVGGALWMILTYVLIGMVRLGGWNAQPLFLLLIAVWIGLLAFTARSIWADFEVGRRLAALYLVSLAVMAGGDFFDKHFVAAVPFYFVLLYLRRPAFLDKAISVVAILCLFLYWPGQGHRARLGPSAADYYPPFVAEFDQMMADCGLTRFVGDIKYFAFSKYSPIGPMVTEMGFIPRDHEIYRRTEENVAAAELYMAADGEEYLFAKREDFPYTRPCAREIEGFEARFRTPG